MQKNDLSELPALDHRNIHEYIKRLNATYPNDLAEFLEQRDDVETNLVLIHLSPKMAAETFEYLSFIKQQKVIRLVPTQVAASLLNEMSPDDRIAFIIECPENVYDRILDFLSGPERSLTEKLLGFPEDSVGRLMTTDYIAIKADWTVKQVLDYVRVHGRDSETISVLYVIDKGHKLIDDMRLRELLFASPDVKIAEIADNRFVCLNAYQDQEEAIKLFNRYNRNVLPVVDNEGHMLGIVTIDDVLKLTIEESTADIQQIGGTEALDFPYMQTDLLTLIKKRGSWLVILFLGEMLTASVLGFYETQISKAVVLALFLPLIISSGGNAGSQACTLIIRAMALGELTLKDYWRVMKREIISGLILGSALGVIGFLRVSLWSAVSDIYGPHWLMIAFTICFSLIGVVLWGTISGSMMPFIIKKFGQDPAVSSAPFIATIVDVTGLLIYFNIAMFTLKGTLL